MLPLQVTVTLFSAALLVSVSAHPYSEWGRRLTNMAARDQATIPALEPDKTACVLLTESLNGQNYPVRICTDDGEASNVCFSTRARSCCTGVNLNGKEKSQTTVNVGTTKVTVAFYYAEFNSVCYTLSMDPESESAAIGCSQSDTVDCALPECISVTTACFENTVTGDVSSCDDDVCQCKEGYLSPDCCECNTRTHYGPQCKPYCRVNCATAGPEGSGCATCKEGFVTAPECCDCEPGTTEVNGICKCTGNLAEDGVSCKEGTLKPDCCDCDTTGNATHAFYKTRSGECKPFCKDKCDSVGDMGCATCRTGYAPVPTCCDCDTTGNSTHAYYKTAAEECEPFCRKNCASEGDSGCSACNTGYTSTPKCCDCAEGYEMDNGQCIQTKCDKEQDLYFLIDATISYNYVPFCSMMIVAQMLAAAFNPTSSSGTKLYGVLFQKSGTVEKVFDLGDSCNIVSNQLKTLTKDFSLCKESAYSKTTFKSVCASETIAIKGLQEIEKVAKVSTKKQKAVLILTDGTIDDPNNELSTVMSSLKLAGIETIIAARVGTDQVNDNLKDYANIDSNAIVADEPLELGRKIVERLSAEGILCNDHAEMIKDSLEGVVSNTLPHFCNCVPDVVSGEGCFVYGTEFTLKFPECGGSLNIEFNIGSQEAAKQGDSKLKVEDEILEEKILAAVEDVLENAFHGGMKN